MKATKKLIGITLGLMIAVLARGFAQSNEQAITGVWESDKKDVRMEIYKQGDTYLGMYLWGNQLVEADGITSKKDVKNADPRLRSRNLIGITSLTGLRWNGNDYVDGKIYNAPSGDTYSCKAWVENDKLNLRGYMGVSLLGKTASFHRYKQNK